MTPTLFKTDGTTEEIQPANGSDFTFEELYPILETNTLEILYLHDGTIMLMDEEGSLRESPVTNKQATNIAVTAIQKSGRWYAIAPLLGPVIHCDSEFLK